MDDDNQFTFTLDQTDYSGGLASTGTYTIDNSFTFEPGSIDDLVTGSYNDITVPADGDIKIGDRSLRTLMDTMENRLAILQPDPKKLQKFEALKKAYEHYKHLERLCEIEDDEPEFEF